MSFWSRIGDALKAVGDTVQNAAALTSPVAAANVAANVAATGNVSAATPGSASFGDEIRGVYGDTASKLGVVSDKEAQQWHVAGHLNGSYDLTTPEGWNNVSANAAGVLQPLSDSSFTGPVIHAVAEGYQKVDQTLGAVGLYDAAARSEGNNAFLDFSASAWKKAWDAADQQTGFGPNGFALLGESQNNQFDGANNPFVNAQAAKELKNRYINSWDGIAAGVADTIALGVVDPLAGAGAVAKGSRMATKLSSTVKADAVATRLNAATSAADATAGIGTKLADTAKGTFGGPASVEGNTSALYKAMAATHGFDAVTLRDHYAGLLEHTGQANSMPILDLMARAGKIADPHEQAVVKGNILLAARGSEVARTALIDSAPQLAAGLQRVSSAPTYFAHLDDLATKVAAQPGYNLAAVRQAADRLDMDTASRAELNSYLTDLDKVQAHFDKLDSFAGIGENAATAQNAAEIGMTALDRAKAAMRKRTSFVYQDGTSGATTTVLRWSTRDKNMGFVNVAEPMVGVDHLASELKASGLYTSQEIRDRANAFIGAGTQQGRQHIAEGVLDGMVTRLGAKYNLTRAQLDEITSDLQGARVQASEYLSNAAATAAKDQRMITLSDPGYTSKIAIDKVLLETHIRDSVVIPPVDMLEDAIKVKMNQWSRRDQFGKVADVTNESLQKMTSLWRFMVLARPGLAVRAMADTGLRAVAMAGAANMFLSAVHGAADQARRLGSDSPRIVPLDHAGELRVEQMSERAAALRAQANAATDPIKAQTLHLRADDLESQAQDTRAMGQQFRGDRKTATKGVKVTLNGQTHEFRAYSDEANLKGIEHAVIQGGHQLHEAIAPVVARRANKLTENNDLWTTAMPDSMYWTEKYTRSMDALRNSYTGKRILSDAALPDTHDMLTSLRQDARVRAEWQQVKEDHPSLNAWIEDMVNLTDFHAPTHEIRQALLGDRITPEQIDSLFNDANGVGGKVDRMPVNGPGVSHAVGKDATSNAWKAQRDKLYRNLLDKPDIHLVRMPLYKAQFKSHVLDQVANMSRDGVRHFSGEDLARIESNARHRAIQDVRQSMVNTMRTTGAMESLRVAAPFLSPWQDAMESWGRLMYDNPAIAGTWMRYWNLPANAGLVVDQDGQIIKPWEDTASEGKTKFIKIPLPKGVQNLTGLEDIRLRQDSLNSAFQGDVPWVPGFGPFHTIAAAQLVGHIMPELGDSKNPIIRSLFPFGLPEGSNQLSAVPGQLAAQFLPAWARSLRNGMDQNTAEFGRAYSTALNGNIVDFTNKNGRKPNSEELAPLQRKARSAVRTAMVLKGAVLGLFGMSTTNNVRGQFYVEQMHQLYALEPQLQAKGYTVTEAFNYLFPEAADMKWTATDNPTGITYTMQAENAARRYKDKINANPDYGWFYAGTDNMGGQYSPTANALQKGELYGPDGVHRRTLSPDEQDRKAQAEMGWAEYQKFSTAAQVELEKRGLHSMAQKGAADIQALRTKLRDQLFAEYPEFQKDYNQNAGSVINKFEPVLADALKDPRLKNRPDVRAIAQYVSLRQQTLDLLKNNKGRSADLKDPRNADVAEYLRQQGETLSRQNLGFQQAWQRIFSREVDS